MGISCRFKNSRYAWLEQPNRSTCTGLVKHGPQLVAQLRYEVAVVTSFHEVVRLHALPEKTGLSRFCRLRTGGDYPRLNTT